jgi:hypothetical protein
MIGAGNAAAPRFAASAGAGIASGHDVRTVAGRLGHADPSMTLRVYAHAVEAADQAEVLTLASLLDGLVSELARRRWQRDRPIHPVVG